MTHLSCLEYRLWILCWDQLQQILIVFQPIVPAPENDCKWKTELYLIRSGWETNTYKEEEEGLEEDGEEGGEEMKVEEEDEELEVGRRGSRTRNMSHELTKDDTGLYSPDPCLIVWLKNKFSFSLRTILSIYAVAAHIRNRIVLTSKWHARNLHAFQEKSSLENIDVNSLALWDLNGNSDK